MEILRCENSLVETRLEWRTIDVESFMENWQIALDTIPSVQTFEMGHVFPKIAQIGRGYCIASREDRILLLGGN